jgi:diguanylate cyclase (GGDEF)-like protein
MPSRRWTNEVTYWKPHDDGRVWLGMYIARIAMLLSLALVATLVGAQRASVVVLAVVIPHAFLCALSHRQTGRAHRLLPLDQPLAALCALVAPHAALGSVISMVVLGGDALGVSARRVRNFAVAGSALLLLAAAVHRDAALAGFVLPQLAASMATANLVSYLKNKRAATSDRLESLLDGLHAYVHESDLETGEIVYCNQHIVNRLGAITTIREMTKQIHPDDVAHVVRSHARGAATLTPVTLELRVIFGDDIVYMEQRTTFAKYRGRTRLRSVMFDVSARKRVELEMEHRAFHDPLTDLPNRSLFLDRLTHAIDRADRASTEHAVLLLDLDSFKDVNDGMGHQVGDELLKEIAGRLNRKTRRTDTLARLGGDEFAIVLEDTAPEAAVLVARQLIDAVGHAYSIGETTLFPRVSIGVAHFPGNGRTPSELLRNADAAMYHAKRLRLGVAEFSDDMHSSSIEKLALLADFRTALTNRELEAYFQPVVDAVSCRISSCEALVRWNHPRLGRLTPAAFVPIISAGGLSSDLARWMLTEALAQIEQWVESGSVVPIAVNMSAIDVANTELVDWLLSEVGRRSIRPALLTIELTEAELLDQSTKTLETLQRLSTAGITITVDDFGTGYSSLVWLRDLPIRTLKIDRSFIESMFTDERSETIIRSTIQMAKALQLNIVGEGVEDYETAVALRDLGCHNLQGFHFSRPIPAGEMGAFFVGGNYAADRMLGEDALVLAV